MLQKCEHDDCENRNNAGFCKTTLCINARYSNIGTAQYGQGVQKRIITNADRIRAMSDMELARLLERVQYRIASEIYSELDIVNELRWNSASIINREYEWLKEEAE